jgi:hypothetical protein
MIDRLSDWYRLVNITPEHETIEKRTITINRAINQITAERESGFEFLLGLVDGAAAEFSPSVSQRLLEMLRDDDKSVSSSVENALVELKLTAAAICGEVANKEENGPVQLLGGACLRSALQLGLTKTTKQKHWNEIRTELAIKAIQVLSYASSGVRGEASPPNVSLVGAVSAFDQIQKTAESAVNGAQLWAALRPPLQRLLAGVASNQARFEQELAKTKEEVDILWWLFGGLSKITGQRFTDMSDTDVALAAAYEFESMSLTPPVKHSSEFLSRAVGSADRQTSLTLSEFVEGLSLELLQAVEIESQLSELHPAITPILSVLLNVVRSGTKKNWKDRLPQKNGITVGVKGTPLEWANHILGERVTQRIWELRVKLVA